MKRLYCLQLATSCLLVLGPSLEARASEHRLEARQRIEARIAAKLARLERLGNEPGPDPARRSAQPADTAEGAAGGGGTGSETIRVDCDQNKSVSRAIARSNARYLRVEVSGTCAETVIVERSGVTIVGSGAGGATIDPPDDGDGLPTGPAIRALGAHELVLENLTLTGGLNGLDATGSRRLRLTGVRANSNPGAVSVFVDGYGVRLDGSEAVIAGSELSANGRLSPLTGGPIVVMKGSHAEVIDSVMVDNPVDGPFSVWNSSLSISRCRIANNALGPQAIANSRTFVASSTEDSSGSHFAMHHSTLTYSDTTITNMVSALVSGTSQLTYFLSEVQTLYVVAERVSSVGLAGTTVRGWCPFACRPGDDGFLSVQVLDHSSALAARAHDHGSNIWVDSNVRGEIVLDTFSDGSFNTGEPIAGVVECNVRSRVFTNLPPAGGTSESCE